MALADAIKGIERKHGGKPSRIGQVLDVLADDPDGRDAFNEALRDPERVSATALSRVLKAELDVTLSADAILKWRRDNGVTTGG